MGEFNNCKRNIFNKAMKEKLSFKNMDVAESNNIPSSGVNQEELEDLRRYAIDQFKNNKKVFKRIRRVKNLKFFFNYGVPIISLAVASSFILQQPRDEKLVSKYAIQQTMISDGKMIQDYDDGDYVVTDYEPFDDDLDLIEVKDTNSIIQYQVKNGTHSVIITVNVDENGQLSIGDSMSGNFFDRNAAVFEGVEPSDIEAKYQEIVDDIGAFIQDSNLNNSYKNEIKELLEQERTVIITTIVEYIKTGDINVIESIDSSKKDIAFWEFIAVLITALVAVLVNMLGLGKIKKLDSNYSSLFISSSKENLIPFATSNRQKDKYISTEHERRNKVKSLAKEYLTKESFKHFDI